MFEALLFEKLLSKMLMKLTPGVNLINIFWAAFTHADPKSVKRYWQIDEIDSWMFIDLSVSA